MEYRKSAKIDNTLHPIQQQVFTLAQDSLPLPTVSTVPLQTVPSGTVPRKSINGIFIRIALALTLVGMVLWILNATGIIQGPWAGLFGPIIASSGIFLRLLSLKLAEVPATPVPTVPLAPDTQPLDSVNNGFAVPYPDEEEGLLLAYAKKSLRGFNVDLFRGFEESTIYAAQNIVERKTGNHKYYVAVFQSLPPGPYTAHVYKKELIARVTINPGQIAMIDWR